MPPDDAVGGARNLRPWVKGAGAERGRLEAFEREVVARVNHVIAGWGGDAIERVTQIYREVDETCLATVAELDHYGVREGAEYWGPVGGNAEWRMTNAEWPLTPALSPEYRGEGVKVFAYLKDFQALPAVLGALGGAGCEALVVCDGVPGEVRWRFAGAGRVRLVDRPVDLGAAAKWCDLAVLNAGHGATAGMLLAGVPVFLVPIHLEQGLLARAAVRNTGGAAVEGPCGDGEKCARRLAEMLQDEALARHAAAARQFARKYATLDPAAQVGWMVERVEGLMEERGRGADEERGRRAERGKVFAG